MAPTEIENLVVRLSGDTTSLQKSLRSAETMVKGSAADLAAEGRKLTETMKNGQERYAERVSHLNKLLKAGAIDHKTYGRAVGEAGRDMRKWNDAQEEGSNLTQIMSRRLRFLGLQFRGFGSDAAAAILPLIGLSSGIGMIRKGIALFAEEEQNQITFGTILGDMKLGEEMVGDIQTLAAKTPMSTRGLQSAAKMLLQFGIQGDRVLPMLRQLGDVVGGDEQKLQSMALAFGQMSSTGRLMGEELNQMISAGFNPLRILAEDLAGPGASLASVNQQMVSLKKKMEAGGVSVAMVNKAFKIATSEGGKFAGLMEKQSQSLQGLFSTMEDDVDSFFRSLGRDVAELFHLKDLMSGVSAAVQSLTDALNGLSPQTKKMVLGLGAAAAAAVGLAFAWPLIGRLGPPVFKQLAKSIWLVVNPLNAVKLAWVALSLVITRSPIGIAINLIAGAFGLLAGMFVAKSGGIVEALVAIKDGALRAWEWTRPIRQALVSFFGSVYEVIRDVGTRVQQFLSQLWDVVTGSATVNWGKIRDAIVTVILFAEYTVRNFSRVATLVWLKIKLGFMQMVEGIRDGVVWLVALVTGGAAGIGDAFDVLRGVIAGTIDPADMGARVGAAFTDAFNAAKNALGHGNESALTKRWRAEMEAQQKVVDEGFQKFKEDKLKQFEEERNAQQKHNDEKLALEDKYQSALAGRQEKEDAVLLRSNEARARVLEQRRKLLAKDAQGNPMDPATVAAKQFADKQKANMDAYKKQFGGYKPVGPSWAYPGIPLKGQPHSTIVAPPPPPGAPDIDPKDLASFGKPGKTAVDHFVYWRGDEKDPKHRATIENVQREQLAALKKIEEFLKANNANNAGLNVAPANLGGI